MAESLRGAAQVPSVPPSSLPSASKPTTLTWNIGQVPSLNTFNFVWGTAPSTPATFGALDSGQSAQHATPINMGTLQLSQDVGGTTKMIATIAGADLSAGTVGHHLFLGVTTAADPPVSGTAIDIVVDVGALQA
jgi:hypothetical protein